MHLLNLIARLLRFLLSPHVLLDQSLFRSNIRVDTFGHRSSGTRSAPQPLMTDSRGFTIVICTRTCPITYSTSILSLQCLFCRLDQRETLNETHSKPGIVKKECTRIWTLITTKHQLPTVWHQRLITHNMRTVLLYFTLLYSTACLKYDGPLF